jgi:hypothetical protein
MRLIIESDYELVLGGNLGRDALERAQQFIDEFLVFVKANDVCHDVIDEIELPAPKSLLVSAFCVVIAAERRPDIRSLLIKAGITLAQYRPGLGPRIRVTPGSPRWRSEPTMSKVHARRLEQTLLRVAEERVQLAETYLRAVSRSLN